jgi:hypothetical protein
LRKDVDRPEWFDPADPVDRRGKMELRAFTLELKATTVGFT